MQFEFEVPLNTGIAGVPPAPRRRRVITFLANIFALRGQCGREVNALTRFLGLNCGGTKL